MLTYELGKHTSATIIERQSTFVRLLTKDSIEYKIRYINKYEYLIEYLEVVGIEITGSHPILEHYHQNRTKIYLSSKVDNPQDIINEFEKMVKSEYSGWRNLDECFNGGNRLLTSIFKGGHGILYDGPEVLAKKVEYLLQRNGIQYKSVPESVKERSQVKALLIGENIVVAKDFKIERV